MEASAASLAAPNGRSELDMNGPRTNAAHQPGEAGVRGFRTGRLVGREGLEPSTKRLRVRRPFTESLTISHLRRLPLRIPV